MRFPVTSTPPNPGCRSDLSAALLSVAGVRGHAVRSTTAAEVVAELGSSA
jgi:hypothetical protein